MPYSVEVDSSIAQAKQAYGDREYERSTSSFAKAIELIEKDTSGATVDYDLHVLYSNRCACNLQLGRHELALRDAKRSVELRADFAKGHSRLGQCYEALGNNVEALKAYERVVALDRTNTDAFKRMNSLRQRDRATNNRDGSRSSASGSNSSSSGMSIVSSLIQKALLLVNRLIGFYSGLNHEFRRNFGIGCALLLAYVAYCRLFTHNTYDYAYDGYGGYGGGYGGGLSWTAWIAIVAAAYYVPPHIPQLGGMAQPFFGMSFSSFVYFLSMLTRGGGGGYGGGGFFGPGRGGFGSPYRRRRYY